MAAGKSGRFLEERHVDKSGAGINAPSEVPESNKSRDPGYPIGGSLDGASRSALTGGYTGHGAIDAGSSSRKFK